MARAVSRDVVLLGSRRNAKLEAIVRRASAPQALVLRARIVLLAHANWPNAQIAARLGCTVNTVRAWRRRFVRGGIPALFDRPRRGRPRCTGPLSSHCTSTNLPVNKPQAPAIPCSFHADQLILAEPGRRFGLLTEKVLRRGVHKSVRQLEKDILAWGDAWNEDPKPFIWTKSAEEILESLRRLLRRIKDPGH